MASDDLNGCAGILVALGAMACAVALVFGESIAELFKAIFR